MKTITVVGAGKVGATVAQLLGIYKMGDVLLMDINGDKALGVAMDLGQAGYRVKYSETFKKSDAVIITAGFARKRGMSRGELYEKNSKVIDDVLRQCVKVSPDAKYIFVTNPVDRIAKLASKFRLKEQQVYVMGSQLDSLRFRYFIKKKVEELGFKVYDIEGEVTGKHNAVDMEFLIDKTTVNGKPIRIFLNESQLVEAADRTRYAGEELVTLCKGSAYAPAEGVVEILRGIK